MKIKLNCPRCIKEVIADTDFIGCFICPICKCVVAKIYEMNICQINGCNEKISQPADTWVDNKGKTFFVCRRCKEELIYY